MLIWDDAPASKGPPALLTSTRQAGPEPASATNRAVAIFLLTATLAALVVSTFRVPTTSAAGPTYVSGIMGSNTTWTLDGSPYIVVADVIVAPGVTLTVEPGVEVRFEPATTLWVKGTLNAVGMEAQNITFTRNGASAWSGIRVDSGTGPASATIGHAVIEGAEAGIAMTGTNSLTLNLSDSLIQNSAVGVSCEWDFQTGSPTWTVSYNTFTGNGTALNCGSNWSGQIDHNIIRSNGFGLDAGFGGSIRYNTIVDNDLGGIAAQRGPIQYNVISNNGAEGIIGFRGDDLSFNTITGNALIGISVHPTGAVGIHSNNIYGNCTYGLRLSGATSVDATGNWWGTISTPAISNAIWDFWDNPALGIVTFEPFRTVPVPEAPVGPIPPCGSVGGIAEYPQLEAAPGASGSSAPSAPAVAGLATGAILLLAAGGWYARRRRLT